MSVAYRIVDIIAIINEYTSKILGHDVSLCTQAETPHLLPLHSPWDNTQVTKIPDWMIGLEK